MCLQCGRYRHQHQPSATINDFSENRLPPVAAGGEPPVRPANPNQ